MSRVLFILLISTCVFGCNDKTSTFSNYDGITIEIGISYKYDLTNSKYTVYFAGKKPYEVEYRLSKKDKDQIVNSFNLLNIEKFLATHKTVDTRILACDLLNLPTIFTTINLNTNNIKETISVAGICKQFNTDDKQFANALNSFLQSVMSSIGQTKEVASAPESDVLYY